MIFPSTPKVSNSPFILSFSLFSGCLLLASCGNSASNLASKSLDSVKNLLPSSVPIATVRSKDLKEMPSGADRALAWNQSLNQWVYVNIDYNPATLPNSQTQPIDSGLLPPLNSNSAEGTILDTSGQLPGE